MKHGTTPKNVTIESNFELKSNTDKLSSRKVENLTPTAIGGGTTTRVHKNN